ncbi:Putative transport protein [Salmonella bongori]|nr:Putative transport protein [Salmonella bongori]
MDSVELSRSTRWGMMLTGFLQGGLCYLLMAWLVPQNSDWLFYGMPATIALSATLLLTVVSFKQGALWAWLALIFIVVLAMSGWLKWQVESVDKMAPVRSLVAVWSPAGVDGDAGFALDSIPTAFANRFGALSPILYAVMA